jgi:hypothetical protein
MFKKIEVLDCPNSCKPGSEFDSDVFNIHSVPYIFS